MFYSIKNIKNFWKSDRVIFVICFVSIFISSMLLYFSFNVYENYVAEIGKQKEEGKEITISLDKVNKKEATDYINDLPKEIKEETYSVTVTSCSEEKEIYSHFCFVNDKISFFSTLNENLSTNGALCEGKIYDINDFTTGKKVVDIALPDNYETEGYKGPKTIKLFGENYNVIGIQSMVSYMVPYTSIPDSANIKELYISMKNEITKDAYDTIRENAQKRFEDRYVVSNLEFKNSELMKFYYQIIMIDLIIMMISLLNFGFLYSYILSKRKKQIRVLRICGFHRNKTKNIYLWECMILVIPTHIFALLSYFIFITPKIARFYENVDRSNKLSSILVIFVIYILASVFVLNIIVSRFIKKNCLEV